MTFRKPNWEFISKSWPKNCKLVRKDTWDQIVEAWTTAMISACKQGNGKFYVDIEQAICEASGRKPPGIPYFPMNGFEKMFSLTEELYVKDIDREFPLKLIEILSKDLGEERIYIE